MFKVFKELQIVLVAMGYSKRKIVLLLVASGVLFSIFVIVRFICVYMYSSITCQQNDYLSINGHQKTKEMSTI